MGLKCPKMVLLVASPDQVCWLALSLEPELRRLWLNHPPAGLPPMKGIAFDEWTASNEGDGI